MGKNIGLACKAGLVMLLLVFTPHLWGRTAEPAEAQTLALHRQLAAFSATGASLQLYRMNQFGRLSGVSTPAQMLKTGQVWSRSLDLPVREALTTEADRQVYRSEGMWGGAHATLMMIAITGKDSAVNYYYTVQVEGFDAAGLEYNWLRLKQHFLRNATLPQINISIQGGVSGILNSAELNGMIRQVLEQLEVQEIEHFADGQLICVSGYSRLFHRAITANHHAYNLQVSVHTDERDKQTLITIGTPVINVEY